MSLAITPLILRSNCMHHTDHGYTAISMRQRALLNTGLFQDQGHQKRQSVYELVSDDVDSFSESGYVNLGKKTNFLD